MLAAMILAHLVGDYLLQNDALARWKARELRGVLVHGSIVLLVTLLFALLFDAAWWPWALGIGLAHIAIDAIKLRLGSSFSALGMFLLDQAAHASTIVVALVLSGKLAPLPAQALLAGLRDERLLVLVIGYVFATLPAWVLIEFLAAACLRVAPEFGGDKYLSSVERGLIATFVLLGQFVLVPLVAAPRLIVEGRGALGGERGQLYLARWTLSVALAVGVGLILRGWSGL
jgi:hypothetical protein